MRQHHRNNHQRQLGHVQSSSLNTNYLRQYDSERRHSTSAASEEYEPRGDSLRQTWFDSIRNRYSNYRTSSRGRSTRDALFPNSLESYYTKYSDLKNSIIGSDSKFLQETDRRQITELRKKTVRFDGSDFDEEDGWMTLANMDRWDCLRQASAESTARDSGIGSNFTTSQESNRGDLKVTLPFSIPFRTSCFRFFFKEGASWVAKISGDTDTSCLFTISNSFYLNEPPY